MNAAIKHSKNTKNIAKRELSELEVKEIVQP
jgi:hypothetical protein